eukprot:6566668-Pyramimonas_sp.AAC.1
MIAGREYVMTTWRTGHSQAMELSWSTWTASPSSTIRRRLLAQTLGFGRCARGWVAPRRWGRSRRRRDRAGALPCARRSIVFGVERPCCLRRPVGQRPPPSCR